jgi:hypothetical protein
LILIGCMTAALCAAALRPPTSSVTQTLVTTHSPEQRIRIDHSLFRIQQQLSVPAGTEVALRLWVQRLPAYEPYITVSGTAGDRRYGPQTVELPPPDGEFHQIQLPWWHIPAGAETLAVSITGHGILVQFAHEDQVPGGNLVVGSRSWPTVDLALALDTRAGGTLGRIPLLQIAQNKPGLLGTPRFALLLAALYVGGVGLLIANGSRLLQLGALHVASNAEHARPADD